MAFRLAPLVVLVAGLLPIAAGGLGQETPADGHFDSSEELYRRSIEAVFRIRVIDVASGDKTSTGSGFQFTPDGLIATNYHVVAELVHRPDRNELQLQGSDETIFSAELIAIDVVNDLALLRAERSARSRAAHLELGTLPASKGAALFSIGDPVDLGMSIVRGAYNGLVDTTLYDKVLFSGSLNPGMSGGPTLDRSGKVVGINVSTWGNELGFLVPVDALRALADSTRRIEAEGLPSPDWHREIERQLDQNQARSIEQMLATPWPSEAFGPLEVPAEISAAFDCWGGRLNVDDDPFEHIFRHCSSGESLYLSDDLDTGELVYRYEWLESRGLDRFRFHRLYEESFDLPIAFENAYLDSVGDFHCRTRHVEIGARPWRSALCARRYKDYPELYDAHLTLALVGEAHLGFLVQIVVQGISRPSAQSFFRRFMEEIEWAE